MKLAAHDTYDAYNIICVRRSQNVPQLCPFCKILKYPYILILCDKAWITHQNQ